MPNVPVLLKKNNKKKKQQGENQRESQMLAETF